VTGTVGLLATLAIAVVACGGPGSVAATATPGVPPAGQPSPTGTATARPVPSIDRKFASQECAAPEAAQFDFWVGIWDVAVRSANGVEVSGTQTITKEGCYILEHFDAPLGGRAGYIGESVSQWVPSLGKWQQRYADNNGFAATYTGAFEGGAMILYQSADDGTVRNSSRLVWKDIEPDRHLWQNEVTRDGGKTWTANIVIRYERRR